MGCVYQAKNKIDGKCYIGKTLTTLEKRKRTHLVSVKNNSKYYFHQALKKYGPEEFEWSVLEDSDNNDTLCEKEQEFIKFYKTKVPYGYNLTDGGEGTSGYKLTKEQCLKISINKKGNKYNLGRRHNEDIKKKMSFAKRGNQYRLGVKVSEFTKKKISIYRTGKKTGPLSEEIKNKIRLSKKGKKRKPFSFEWKRNMSIALLGNRHRRGKKTSENTKIKMSQALKGNKNALGKTHYVSEETKKKMSRSLMGNKNALGKIRTEKTKERMSLAAKNRWRKL
jgi:group I intron endonuclease